MAKQKKKKRKEQREETEKTEKKLLLKYIYICVGEGHLFGRCNVQKQNSIYTHTTLN